MLLFIQCDHCPTHRIARFQNILCYCLSIQGITLAGMFFEFQNILCYCLSRLRGRIFSGKLDFKTSYVIVYRISESILRAISKISKHLMLLFIPRISAFFSFSPPLFPLIFSIFLHFLPANTLILDRPTYHPINLLIFQAFLDFSFFFRLVKIL